jgi:DNA-binding MarR family transcriptional regulator
VDAKDVRDAIRSRRMRDQFFEPAGLFEDPAWDMLLDLFAAHLEGARVSVSSLCIAAAVAPTTALRWIGRMTGAGLFVRTPDPEDRRRAFIDLSDGAIAAIRDYCTAAKRQGLPIA